MGCSKVFPQEKTQKQLCFWQSKERAPSRAKGKEKLVNKDCLGCFLKTNVQNCVREALLVVKLPSCGEIAFLWLKITESETFPETLVKAN